MKLKPSVKLHNPSLLDPDPYIPLFEPDGTAFKCLVCGGFGEVVIEDSGAIPGTPSNPTGQWFEGKIVCDGCGAEEFYSDSSV